jgi:hypothetical protein
MNWKRYTATHENILFFCDVHIKHFGHPSGSCKTICVPYCSMDNVMNACRSLYSVFVIYQPKKDDNNQR